MLRPTASWALRHHDHDVERGACGQSLSSESSCSYEGDDKQLRLAYARSRQSYRRSRRARIHCFQAMLCLLTFQLYLYYADVINEAEQAVVTVPDSIDRQDEWIWSNYSRPETHTSTDPNSPTSRLLIAQFSGSAKYNRMLDVSQHLNRAYARLYKHDYVAFLGLALGGYKNYHANFNKLEILRVAQQEGYDGVLLIDADAVIVNFEQNVVDQLDDQFAISAQFEYFHHFPFFNAGVTLWNLNHPRTNQIIQNWYQVSAWSVQHDMQAKSELLFGDQSLLHMVLLPIHPFVGGPSHLINTRPNSLSLIKHVKRPYSDRFLWDRPVDARIKTLIKYANYACAKYLPVCDGIPYRVEY